MVEEDGILVEDEVIVGMVEEDGVLVGVLVVEPGVSAGERALMEGVTTVSEEATPGLTLEETPESRELETVAAIPGMEVKVVDEELDMVGRGRTKDKFRALGGRGCNG